MVRICLPEGGTKHTNILGEKNTMVHETVLEKSCRMRLLVWILADCETLPNFLFINFQEQDLQCMS
jgi:hypothetical protein